MQIVLRKMVTWFFVVTLLLSAVSSPAAALASAQPERGAASYAVRVAGHARDGLARLGLRPEAALSYGAFDWLVLDEANFARLSASPVAFDLIPQAGVVQVTGYRFDPLVEGEPEFSADMRAAREGPGFRLVQFFGPVQDAWLAQLEAAGLRVLQYYPNNAFLTWGTPEQARAAERLSAVRWQGDFHPVYKINSDLAGRSGQINNVDIVFYNDGNILNSLAEINSLGGKIIQYYPSQPDQAFFDAIVQLDAGSIEAIARLDTVLWMGYSYPDPVMEDEMSSQILAGNYVSGVPFTGYFDHLADLGVDGAGVTWAIIDTGVDYDHPDLGSHIVGGYDFPGSCSVPGQPGSDCSGGGHGTHVAGIVGGDATGGFTDANGFLYGLGIAPAYGIFAMNSGSGPDWPPSGGWQEHSKRAVLGNAIGGNNSWTTGEGENHGYQASERTHDIMVLDGNFDTTNIAEPFIEVFSAGNSGPSPHTLTAPKEAKNLIVVASSLNYRVGDINNLSSFSSRGPAVDGRWVPTVTAPGEQIASSRNDLGGSCSTSIPGTNNLYAYCSGTSMASPHVSGAVVLATEWWRTFNAGADPSSAMAKALLVNGAVDMGTADIPNANEGWGRVNITNVVSPTVNTLHFDQPLIFDNSGEQWVLEVAVLDPSQPLKVSLAWADAPGAAGANPALVNNLNLTVVNDGTTYRGNVFSGGWSTTGGSADALNNLENVYIQNPGVSTFITIDAANIAGDAILYQGDATDQSFALVCSNCVAGAGNLITSPNNLQKTVLLGSVATSDLNLFNLTAAPVNYQMSEGSAVTWLSQSPMTGTIPTSTLQTIQVTFDASVPEVGGPGDYTVDLHVLNDSATPDIVIPVTMTVVEAGVFVTPQSSAQSGDPGTQVVYDLMLTNSGTIADSFDVSAGGGAWNTTAPAVVGPLAAGESTSVQVAVDIPAGALGGEIDLAAVTFTSQLDPTTSDDAQISTTANAVYGLDVTPAADAASGDPGASVYYTLTVSNLANITDTFDIAASGNTWQVNLPASVGPLAVGEQAQVIVQVEVAAEALTGETDAASVTFTSQGDNAASQSALLTTSANTFYDLIVDPLADAASGNPGGTVTYQLYVTNTGNIAETFDVKLSGNAWTSNAPASVGPLAVGQGQMVAVTVNIPAKAMGNDQDSVQVSIASHQRPASSQEATLTTSARPIYGLLMLPGSLALTGDAGATVTYTLAVLNTANITDTFTLTADSAWTVTAPASFGPLGPNRSASLKVAVTIPADAADGTLDAAQITLTSQGDGLTAASAMLNTTANNPAPPEADLSVSQTAPATAQVGGQIAYTIVVNNAGPGEALNVELVDTLPAGVTFVSASAASCTHAAGVVTCALGSLAAGGEATLTIAVQVDAAGSLQNSVSVSAENDPQTANNTDTADTTATALPSQSELYLPLIQK